MKTKEIKLPAIPFKRSHIKDWDFFIEYENTCLDTFKMIKEVDFYNIGSKKYMGFAWFWNYEYRHYLRDASYVTRQIIHDRLLDFDLELSGESSKHHLIITAYCDDE